MELRPGYKKTEIGVIPEDWEVLALKQVLTSLELGGNYPNATAPSPFPLMKMGNVSRGSFDLSKIEFVFGTPPSERHRLRSGDVIFNTRNTLDLVGKIAIWRDEIPVAYFNSNLMRLQFDPAVISSQHYANLTLNTEAALSRLRAMATGTTSVAAIYTRDLLGLPIVVPPRPEQKVIAEALSDVDASIAALSRLIAKKRDLRLGAMQCLLTGQTRLPGFTAPWRETSFASLVRHHAGNSSLIKGKLSPYPIPGFFAAYSASGQDVWHSAFEFEGAAIIVSAVGSRCGKAFVADGKWSAIANTHVVWPNNTFVTTDFLMLFLNDEDFWQKSGTGQPFVLFKQTFQRRVHLPCVNEQAAIARVLTDMDAEINALDARLNKTRALKQAMMQALLTGRVRLPVRRDAAPQTKEAAHA